MFARRVAPPRTPCLKVHALGKDSTKNPALKRPWKPEEQPNPFADLAKAFNPEVKPEVQVDCVCVVYPGVCWCVTEGGGAG